MQSARVADQRTWLIGRSERKQTELDQSMLPKLVFPLWLLASAAAAPPML